MVLRRTVLRIVGRDEELASVTAFIDGAADGSAALVLEGEAGIGKSALWGTGVELARARGFTVLVSRPAEAEGSLAHAGLGDLFDAVLDDVLPALSPPRQHALRVAMLRDEASEDAVDHRALAVAVRDVLHLLSERGPLLVAIDDVQWLDASSASALAFAVRRLGAHPVLLLLAQRPGDGTGSSGLEEALAHERLQRLAVGPLSVGAVHQLLRDRLGRSFARQTLLRIHEQSGGNPFYAVELGGALRDDVDPTRPIQVPRTLEGLIQARLAGLSPATNEALGIAAALGATAESLLARAGIAPASLEPAVAANVIERAGGMIRFTHPLLPAVIYHHLGKQRSSVHARIAQSVDDPLVRARHLALSRDAAEATVASELDAAATLAAERGASALAAELCEHAARLTPSDAPDERRRRSLDAARAYQVAGEWTRARAIATDLLASELAGSWRAEALMLLAALEGADRAAALLTEALGEASARPALQSVIHCRLAWAGRFQPESGHADAALQIAERLDDDVLRVNARAVQAVLRWFAGESVAPDDLVELAQHLPDAVGGERLVQEATQAIVNTLAPVAVRQQARSMLETEYREWRLRDEPRSARALWGLAWVEFWAGHWGHAAEHAASAHEIASQYGLEIPQDHLPISVIAVYRGQLDLARHHSERGLELAQEQFGFHPPQHLAVLGLVALREGDPDAALEWLARADEQAATLGWGEPSLRWWTADRVELLLAVGRLDEATSLLDAWEADANRVGREWVLAEALRCRGLLIAAGGNVEEAIGLLTRAIARHGAVGDPFGRARALLALGSVRRRARQKRAARTAIEEALGDFERIGATGWAANARGELGRIGGRTTAEGLTPAEQRVASLVALGRTNREIAAELFLGERTVASHLTHVYAKLGVRSRTELVSKVQKF